MANIGDMLKNSGLGMGLLAMPAVQAIKSSIDRRKRRDAAGNETPDDAAAQPAEAGMRKGGKVKKMAAGGSASKRADGCATKGKTRGKMI